MYVDIRVLKVVTSPYAWKKEGRKVCQGKSKLKGRVKNSAVAFTEAIRQKLDPFSFPRGLIP